MTAINTLWQTHEVFEGPGPLVFEIFQFFSIKLQKKPDFDAKNQFLTIFSKSKH
jgi:hypothetical protein